MPREKYQWIVDAEKQYKKNSKWAKKNRKRQSGNKNNDNVSDQLKAEISSTQSDIKTNIENKEEINKGNLFTKIVNFFLDLVPCNDEIWL
jgi:hypothetical protein